MRSGWWIATALLACVIGFGAGLATAGEPKEHGDAKGPKAGTDHDAAHKTGHEEGPVGQEKLFSRAVDLTLWTIVVFVILLFVLGKYAWGPMLKGLEAREHAIHSAVEEAHKAREETGRLRDEVQRERVKAAEEARATIDEARREAQKQGDDLRAKAMHEIQSERDRLRRDLELARDAALQDLWSETAKLAALVSGKAIGRELNANDHRQLVDEAIAELRKAGADRKREMTGV
jgi:F-type H+-transporting ATPase subunit b